MKNYLTTGQVIDQLKPGQKAIVTNHDGYHSHLVRVPSNGDHTGGFEWRYTYENGAKHVDWFGIDDDVLELLWTIEEGEW